MITSSTHKVHIDYLPEGEEFLICDICGKKIIPNKEKLIFFYCCGNIPGEDVKVHFDACSEECIVTGILQAE